MIPAFFVLIEDLESAVDNWTNLLPLLDYFEDNYIGKNQNC